MNARIAATCILVATSGLAAVACESGGDKPGTSASADKAGGDEAAKEGDTKPASMTDEEIEKAEIPVKEDFEEEAAEAITADTLDDQIDALAEEIEGDN